MNMSIHIVDKNGSRKTVSYNSTKKQTKSFKNSSKSSIESKKTSILWKKQSMLTKKLWKSYKKQEKKEFYWRNHWTNLHLVSKTQWSQQLIIFLHPHTQDQKRSRPRSSQSTDHQSRAKSTQSRTKQSYQRLIMEDVK